MIYLDTAATSHKKPPSVYKTLDSMTRYHSANAGHGASRLSLDASGFIFDAAQSCASLFNISSPENIAFTTNTTFALNMAIKGAIKEGDHVIMSSMEHNSVLRPVYASGVDYTIVYADKSGKINPEDIEDAIQENTKLVVINHVSNICGRIQDIESIGIICKKYNILFLVDAAQSAGVVNIDVCRQNIDMLAFAGHKSLMGPLGTGGLYVKKGLILDTIVEGGSGADSTNKHQSLSMPDRLVSGTMNMPAIAALGKGVDFVQSVGVQNIFCHEKMLLNHFLCGLKNIEGVIIYGEPDDNCAGVISINIKGKGCSEVAQILDNEYNISTRAGLHCAPLAHESIGSFDCGGTVRFSFGYYTKKQDLDRALYAINKICKNKKL